MHFVFCLFKKNVALPTRRIAEFMADARVAERKRAALRRRKEMTCNVESAPSASLKKFIASEEVREYVQYTFSVPELCS